MKDLRIFVASSKELERERNELAFLVLSKEEEFAARGLRVRLAKWEYVDPRLTGARTEDRYLDEMFDCDAAFVLFRNIAGMYTREELDKALEREREGTTRLKAHGILFAADGAADSDAARLRAELPEGSYGVWACMEELRAAFLALVDRVAGMELREAPSDRHVRKITAFLAADEELAEERNAFADTVLNVNDLLEQAHRNIRVQLKFYNPANAESVIESSEMGLVLYGTNYRMFGRKEIDRIYAQVNDETRNPKRFYVFFRDLDEATEKSLDETFKAFRSDFVTKLGHFTCQFGDANALRLGFLLSLERYAGESIEIYSTVGTPTAPVFVGREDELRKLRGLLEPVPGQFPAGRLPVVTGAGGTGKSELVRQYASQLRVQYPGGVFQVDMERVKTWDEAFLGILDGVSNNGVRVRDYLELEDKKGATAEAEPLTGAKVRDALLKKAREAGPMLLVLDNVEGCMALLGREGGFRAAFPSGFSERVLVNVVATARVCDVMLRPGDWAVPFPLGDLSPEDALGLLLGDRSGVNDEERAAAGRVAELLGYRALYLRRVPALIGDLHARTICGSHAELAKALEANLLGTVAEETEGTHLPDVLWNMTRERLLNMPLGTECVKLVQVASFFSPDGFPQHILEHLWKTVVAPGQDERKFARAVEILRRHNLFQSTEPVRIHRLDRAAIRETAKAEPGLEEAVGNALAGYPGMSPEDWLLLADNVGIIAKIPQFALLSGSDPSLQVQLLRLNPELQPVCRWEKISSKDWVALLAECPQFADHCPWEKLSGAAWADLLGVRPQFATLCPWERLDGGNWVTLLRRNPQFSGHCSWGKITVDNWKLVLWCELLRAQPQFAEHCPFEEWSWPGSVWARLLCAQPQLANHCAWETLDGNNWTQLLVHQPQFADRCPWEKLNAEVKKTGLFPHASPVNNWSYLLENQPQLADYCAWETLDGNNWTRLLVHQPQFADRCPWEKLDGGNWASLLAEHPRFADCCQWEKLDGGNWVELLGQRPEFADRCHWETLTGRDWAALLRKHPQFAGRCPWEKLEGRDWAELLEHQPEFAERCHWETLVGWNWAILLCKQPQFAGRCPWEKLEGGDWTWLLRKQPQFAGRCPWDKLTGRDWKDLLGWRPQFADRCAWEKLEGGDWGWLLRWQPQFAGRCPWEKLEGRNWAELLERQPQFADHCPWGKLSKEGFIVPFSPKLDEICPWLIEDRESTEAGVAGRLTDLALRLVAENRLTDAEREYADALNIYRRLAETTPEKHDAGLARTLFNLAFLLKKTGRKAEAKQYVAEAAALYRERWMQTNDNRFLQMWRYTKTEEWKMSPGKLWGFRLFFGGGLALMLGAVLWLAVRLLSGRF